MYIDGKKRDETMLRTLLCNETIKTAIIHEFWL